jgi:hypothetical protein
MIGDTGLKCRTLVSAITNAAPSYYLYRLPVAANITNAALSNELIHTIK